MNGTEESKEQLKDKLEELRHRISELEARVLEQWQTEEDLRLFKAIVESSSEAIAISDPTGQLVYVNPAHEKLFGHSLERARQLNYRNYYPPESVEIIDEVVAPALVRGDSWEGELDVYDANGHLFPLWEHADTIRDAEGKMLYGFGIMRDITEKHGILLIFDEVVTGFRLGLGGAQGLYGVTPDLCATGKAISGGLPLGVLCGRRDIMAIANPKRRLQMLPFSMQTGTFSSNPVCASVALALIAELEKPGTYERLEEVGTKVRQGLRDAIAQSGIEACVTGVPSVFEIWFCKEEPYDHRSAKASDFYKNIRFSDLLLKQGVLKAAEKFFISAVHTDEDIEHTVQAFHVALGQLAKEVA